MAAIACGGDNDPGGGSGAASGSGGQTGGSGGSGGSGGKGGATQGGAAGKGGSGGGAGDAGKGGSSGGSSGQSAGGTSGEAGSDTGGAPPSGELHLVVHDVIPIEAGPCVPETIVPVTEDAVLYTPSANRFFVADDPTSEVDPGDCTIQGNSTMLCLENNTVTFAVDYAEPTVFSMITSEVGDLTVLAGTQRMLLLPLGGRRFAGVAPAGTTSLTFETGDVITLEDIDLAPVLGQDLGALEEYRRYTIALRGTPEGDVARLINPTFRFTLPEAPIAFFQSCEGGILGQSGCNEGGYLSMWTALPEDPQPGETVHLFPRVDEELEDQYEVQSGVGAITVGTWGGDDGLLSACHTVELHFSLDAGGTPVGDLDVDDIGVTMNGDALTVEAGATLEVDPPTRVGLLLDGSYSITAAAAEAAVRDAAKDFVQTMSPETLFTAAQFASEDVVPLPIFRQVAYRGDPMVAAFQMTEGVVTYGTQQDLLGRLDEYDAHPIVTSQSATKLFDAVANASSVLFREDSGGLPTLDSLASSAALDAYSRSPKALLLLSDGTDTASMDVADAATVRERLNGCHVRAYAVAMGDDVDTSVLDVIAGNEVFVADTPQTLAQTFTEVAARIRSTYVLRVVLPAPVTLDTEAVLSVTYGGQTVEATYENPGGCQ